MRLHRGSLFVIVLGVVVTLALALGAELSYRHNQKRLTALQTKLTADALDSAPIDFERRLGQVAGVAANSTDPAGAFRRLMGPSMRPAGPFAAASLLQLHRGRPTLLVHLGTAPIRKVTGPTATALYRRAARSHELVTARAVGHGIQKLGYLVGATGSAGTFVVSGAQSLPVHDVLPVARDSPDAGLDIAIYFGTTTSPGALIASTSSHLPAGGETSRAVVPFGTSKLTVLASPRTSLGGPLAAALPWAVAFAGLVLTILVAVLVERLMRREDQAEDLAGQNELLYRQQREIALTLQRALLPRDFPMIPGVEFAGVYLPGASGTEVGGDWYSVVGADDRRFYFVVGDISGRGVEAAALMAQLRFTIRTLAMLGHSPAAILEHASGEIDIATSDHFATVLVGLVEDRAQLTVASAGHFPPLLLDGTRSEFVPMKTGLPLGLRASPYEPVTVALAPGTTLIAFTDGLAETRTAGLDEGLERLRAAATAHGASRVDDLVASITNELIPAGTDDDVALLAIRVAPSRVRDARPVPTTEPAVPILDREP